MNTSAHPAPEALSAYFDKELPAPEQAAVESHLSDCGACRAELEMFVLMAELGPRVEESLPGESYWKDLPDRILQRVLMEHAIPAEPEPAAGGWRRIFSGLSSGRSFWRPALAGVAGLAVVGAVWITVQRTPNPWAPVPVADRGTAELTVPEELQPAVSPEQETATGFAQRIFLTYGNRENMGTSLDLLPGQVISTDGSHSAGSQVGQDGSFDAAGTGAVSQVSLLNDDMRALANEVVSYSCGEDSLELVYVAALRAEQTGRYDLAALGYQMLMQRLRPDDRLYLYADYRLNYLVWKVRMQRAMAGQGKTLAELNRLADRSYQAWEKTGRETDCRKAWCMNRVLQQIGPEATAPVPVQHASTRIEQLRDCMQ